MNGTGCTSIPSTDSRYPKGKSSGGGGDAAANAVVEADARQLVGLRRREQRRLGRRGDEDDPVAHRRRPHADRSHPVKAVRAGDADGLRVDVVIVQ